MALTMSVNTPTKYGSNPLLEPPGANTATWDYDKNYVTALKVDGTYYAWYPGMNEAYTQYHLCLATSADGLSWTKPNLGLVSYGGDTDNNIIMAWGDGVGNTAVVHDPDAPADRRYMFLLENSPDGDNALYKSAGGQSLTFVHNLTSIYGYSETKALLRRHDGYWLAYYRFDNNIRRIGVQISRTTDPTGEWADYGIVINATEVIAQNYGLGVWRGGDIYFASVLIFNETTEQMWPSLYVSRNGLDWTLAKSDWLPLGADGAWDDQMILTGKSIIQEGNDWRYYYIGSDVVHTPEAGVGTPFNSRIGLASIGYRRIGQIAGTGDFTTTAITPADGEKLYVNCDASGGNKIEVEVIEGGSPKTSYTQADADDVTTDTYETEVTWGGTSLPTGAEIKLKFYLTGATLYSYEIK